MNFPLSSILRGRPAEEVAAAPVLVFVAEHEVALWHAAELLGGTPHARLVDRLVAEMKRTRRLTPRIQFMLRQLVALLTLEHVDDFDRPEAARFAEIDPADPVVADLCLLSDSLQAAIAAAEVELRRFKALAAMGHAA